MKYFLQKEKNVFCQNKIAKEEKKKAIKIEFEAKTGIEVK